MVHLAKQNLPFERTKPPFNDAHVSITFLANGKIYLKVRDKVKECTI